MSDIALIWNSSGFADIGTQGNDLLTDDGLQTAAIVSLFSDRLISEEEKALYLKSGRGGYWGDLDALPSNLTGSRLWLLDREKTLKDVLTRAKEYAEEALQWMLDDKVASSVEVIAESDRFQELDLQISISRVGGGIVEFRYSYNWQAQLAKIAE